jgi:hypothetical protein
MTEQPKENAIANKPEGKLDPQRKGKETELLAGY